MVKPRVQLAPRASRSRGKEAIGLAESAGLVLDDWQQLAIMLALRTLKGRWAAPEVGISVARQNGKGGILETRELAGAYLFKEPLITHSAHLIDTSLEAFLRLKTLIEETPELERQVRSIRSTNGQESIELVNRCRVRFRTRTKGGGRGFSGQCLILDEAMFLPEIAYGSLLPTISAQPDFQAIYTGSAVDQQIHEHGVVFARVRERGHAGAPELVWLEWSAAASLDDVMDVIDSEEAWREANPAYGIRISERAVRLERRAMADRTFAVERLGVGDWPSTDVSPALIPLEAWLALTDPRSVLQDPVCLAIDVTPNHSRAAISAAGLRDDALLHLETVDSRPGVGWVPGRVAELTEQHEVLSVTLDPASPAAALVRPLERFGIEAETVNAREYAQACGLIFDLIEQQGFRHLGTDELTAAVKNASTRPLGEAWAWSRRKSSVDISPLVAGTLALWQASEAQGSVYSDRGLLAV